MKRITTESKAQESTATLSVPDAGRMLGLSRNLAYKAAADGSFPVTVIRVGKRLVVPRAPLLRLLGIDTPSDG